MLAYAMSFEADADLAMVLPLPTPAGAGEAALAFIDLSGYDTFFDDLLAGFPVPRSQGLSLSMGLGDLTVHRFGAFDASFVPTARDFARLDRRFQLPHAVLRERPAYGDWGFAVFKLHGDGELQDPHPMAFSFTRRDPARLFFPTLHVHDGKLAATAEFDHLLFAQFAGDAPDGWISTQQPARGHVDIARARGLVDGALEIAKHGLFGTQPNGDRWA